MKTQDKTGNKVRRLTYLHLSLLSPRGHPVACSNVLLCAVSSWTLALSDTDVESGAGDFFLSLLKS